MPFKKRNKYKAEIKKQNKLIEKRLLEISICVDDYIYNNKAIPVTQAENYAREILTYKLQCNGEIRMLQVIEKLTRFMKSIIEETTKTMRVNQNTIASVIEKSVLPSTSSVDKEDSSGMCEVDKSFDNLAYKNIISNNIEEEPANHNENESMCVIANEKEYCEINDTTLTLPANIKNSRKVEITSAFTTKDIPTENCNIDQLKHNNDTVNSGHVNESNNKIKLNEERATTTNSKPNTNIENTRHKFTPPLKSYQTIPEAINCKDTRSLPSQRNQTGDRNNRNNKTINKPTDQRDTGKKRKHTPKESEKDIKIVKSHNDTPRRRASNKKKSTQKNNPKGNSSPQLLPMNTRVTPNNKHTCVEVIHELPVLASCDKPFVPNDLSWIDGIRYVREVDSTEFDVQSNVLDETFWDNCTLPSSEFLY